MFYGNLLESDNNVRLGNKVIIIISIMNICDTTNIMLRAIYYSINQGKNTPKMVYLSCLYSIYLVYLFYLSLVYSIFVLRVTAVWSYAPYLTCNWLFWFFNRFERTTIFHVYLRGSVALIKEWVSFFWVHGEWIVARDKQIAWTAKRFSVDLFVPRCYSFPMNPEKRHSFLIFTMRPTKTHSKSHREKL